MSKISYKITVVALICLAIAIVFRLSFQGNENQVRQARPTQEPALTMTAQELEEEKKEDKQDALAEFELFRLKILLRQPIQIDDVLGAYDMKARLSYTWHTIQPIGGNFNTISVEQYELTARIKVGDNIYWFTTLPYLYKTEYDEFGLGNYDIGRLVGLILFRISDTSVEQQIIEFQPDGYVENSFVKCTDQCALQANIEDTCVLIYVSFTESYLLYVPKGYMIQPPIHWPCNAIERKSFSIIGGVLQPTYE